jgi:hypothetical protein
MGGGPKRTAEPSRATRDGDGNGSGNGGNGEGNGNGDSIVEVDAQFRAEAGRRPRIGDHVSISGLDRVMIGGRHVGTLFGDGADEVAEYIEQGYRFSGGISDFDPVSREGWVNLRGTRR